MATITVTTEVTLVTLQNCPSNLTAVHQIFAKAAELSIDIDMISLAPSQSATSSLSFTIADRDLSKLLTFSSCLQSKLQVKTVVSNGNCKLIIADKAMKNQPGFAEKIFGAAAKAKSDIRMITTAETEISLLIPAANLDAAIAAIEQATA